MTKARHIFSVWMVLVPVTLIFDSCRGIEETIPTSQDPIFRLAKLYYENSTGEIGITTFFYDRSGQNYLSHWQLEDSTRSSWNYNEHDSMGHQTRKYREFNDGSTTDQHFYYDENGLMTGQEFTGSDGKIGETVYQYNDAQICTAAVCKGLNGWFYGDLIYHYDSEGTKTGAGIYREGDSIGFVEYSYDYFGNLAGEYWDFNGEWDQTFIYEYRQAAANTFTSSNVFIKESNWYRLAGEQYTYNDETGGPSYYHYTDEGRLAEKEFVRSDGFSTRTSYRYDSTGILRSSLREYHDGGTADFHYWYSIDRKLLVRTFERSNGESGSETYRYDDKGLLVSGELNNFDSWLNGTLSFEYDRDGQLSAGKFEGDDGFDAKLQFRYDLNENLVAIDWDFSFGGFQKYIFKY